MSGASCECCFAQSQSWLAPPLTKLMPAAHLIIAVLLEAKSILIGDTSRPNSTTLDSWDTSTSPCEGSPTQRWSGIACSSDGRVTVM